MAITAQIAIPVLNSPGKSAMHYGKPALSFDDQIELLKSRGLVITDAERVKRWLKRVGYFRLSGYYLPFKIANDKFRDGTTFDQVVDLYRFDAGLRLLFMQAIDRVEVAIRTTIRRSGAALNSEHISE